MFFWRVINAEIWLRIFFDDHVTGLDDHSYAGRVRARGDASRGRRRSDDAQAPAQLCPANFAATCSRAWPTVPSCARSL